MIETRKAGSAPSFEPAKLKSATQGVPISQTITITGGSAPYSTPVISKFLPGTTGLAMSDVTTSPTGVVNIGGTPLDPGICTFTVTIVDAKGFTTSKNYSLTVNVPPGVFLVPGKAGTTRNVPFRVLIDGCFSGQFKNLAPLDTNNYPKFIPVAIFWGSTNYSTTQSVLFAPVGTPGHQSLTGARKNATINLIIFATFRQASNLFEQYF